MGGGTSSFILALQLIVSVSGSNYYDPGNITNRWGDWSHGGLSSTLGGFGSSPWSTPSSSSFFSVFPSSPLMSFSSPSTTSMMPIGSTLPILPVASPPQPMMPIASSSTTMVQATTPAPPTIPPQRIAPAPSFMAMPPVAAPVASTLPVINFPQAAMPSMQYFPTAMPTTATTVPVPAPQVYLPTFSPCARKRAYLASLFPSNLAQNYQTSQFRLPQANQSCPACDLQFSSVRSPSIENSGFTGQAFSSSAYPVGSINLQPAISQPPEARLAWLEYLGNAYIQADELNRASQMLQQMFNWLVMYPRLQGQITAAVRILQRRIDSRRSCTRHCPHDVPLPLKYGHDHPCSDMTPSAASSFVHLMRRIYNHSPGPLSAGERQTCDQIHHMLVLGNATQAMETFRTFLQANPATLQKTEIGKLDFILKLVRFDIENPNNCMPLWRSNCALGWQAKGQIINTFDALRGHRQDGLNSFNGLSGFPLQNEIITRLLVATGDARAWGRLATLRAGDRYLAQACLALRGGQTKIPSITSASLSDPLQGRAQAKAKYELCLADWQVPRQETARCRDGLSQINAISRSCPYGGFVRIGTFTQVFGDFLFVKCLSPPTPPPLNLPPRWTTIVVEKPVKKVIKKVVVVAKRVKKKMAKKVIRKITKKKRLTKATPIYPSRRHVQKIERLMALLGIVRNRLRELEPVHYEACAKLHQLHPAYRESAPAWLATHAAMDERIGTWALRLQRYLDRIRRLRHMGGYDEGWFEPRRARTRPVDHEIYNRLHDYLGELGRDYDGYGKDF